jgi:hypothetical protein
MPVPRVTCPTINPPTILTMLPATSRPTANRATTRRRGRERDLTTPASPRIAFSAICPLTMPRLRRITWRPDIRLVAKPATTRTVGKEPCSTTPSESRPAHINRTIARSAIRCRQTTASSHVRIATNIDSPKRTTSTRTCRVTHGTAERALAAIPAGGNKDCSVRRSFANTLGAHFVDNVTLALNSEETSFKAAPANYCVLNSPKVCGSGRSRSRRCCCNSATVVAFFGTFTTFVCSMTSFCKS